MTGFRFQVRDVRGCERADGICDPIALVAGSNAAGKTSIAQAVAAALTGNALPLEGLNKSNAGMLVRAGAGTGRVEISRETGSTSIEWPSAAPISQGDPPAASLYAVGLSSVATMPARDRARVLSEYLHAAPTFEDVAQVLTAKGWPGETINALWKLVEEQGFDKAHAIRRERGAELKGRWRQITGVNYGSRIAASFRPDMAEPGLNERDLMAAVARAQRDVDNAIATAAVSASEHDRLAVEAEALDLRTEALNRARGEAATAAKALRAAQEHRLSLPPTEQPRTAFCPHCGAEVIVEQVSLMEIRLLAPSGEIDHSAVKERRLAVANAEGKVAHAQDAVNLARRAEAEARAAVEASTRARERIANWPRAIETGTDAEASRLALTRAERTLADWRTKRDADRVHERIETNETALEILAPDGLRTRKLERVLDVFVSSQLSALSDAAGWARVEIRPDMAISYAGRPYALLSSSEQYRTRCILAVAMAVLDGSAGVVIDGADILDAPSRSGLFGMLGSAELAAIVCMTASRREQVPDIERAGFGRSYWLQSGVLSPLTTEQRAA